MHTNDDLPTPVRPATASRLAAAFGLLLLGACATSPPPSAGEPALGGALPAEHREHGPAPADTLYAALGGAAGVEALTTQFVREIAADERIRGHYKNTDIGRFHAKVQEQMCQRTGGGCTYTGDDMRRTHGGMNITPTEFNAVVEALMRAMDARELPVGTQNRLLALYAPMREDIIDR